MKQAQAGYQKPDARRQTASRWRRFLTIVRRIVGVPDYDAYVRHMRAHHPDAELVTPDAFMRNCWEEKYSRPGHRCC